MRAAFGAALSRSPSSPRGGGSTTATPTPTAATQRCADTPAGALPSFDLSALTGGIPGLDQ
jgi:hypothetical protein